jgi:hypothetical protein
MRSHCRLHFTHDVGIAAELVADCGVNAAFVEY